MPPVLTIQLVMRPGALSLSWMEKADRAFPVVAERTRMASVSDSAKYVRCRV
jgi:hypothetical protein